MCQKWKDWPAGQRCFPAVAVQKFLPRGHNADSHSWASKPPTAGRWCTPASPPRPPALAVLFGVAGHLRHLHFCLLTKYILAVWWRWWTKHYFSSLVSFSNKSAGRFRKSTSHCISSSLKNVRSTARYVCTFLLTDYYILSKICWMGRKLYSNKIRSWQVCMEIVHL